MNADANAQDDLERKRETDRRWYQANRERVIERVRKWQEVNKDKKRETERKWRQANRSREIERVGKWQKANPDKVRAASHRWYEANKDKVRENTYRWQEENKDRVTEIARKWRQAHPDRVVEMNHRRRARKTGNGGSYTATELKEKFEQAGNRCAHCGAEGKLTVDHITPLKLGGTNYIENIQPLCRSCNSSKGARVVG